MSLGTLETKLAKYHILHLVIGMILACILFALPKLIAVSVALFVFAMVLPTTLLPMDFTGSKWIDRALVVIGAFLVGGVFHFLHKL
jgi:hypothetical protein